MKPIALVLVCVVASAGTSALTVELARSDAQAAPPSTSVDVALAELAERVSELGRKQEELVRDLSRADTLASPESTNAPRVPVGEIEAAVARALAERAADTESVRPASARESDDGEAFDLAATLAELDDPTLSRQDQQAIWERARAAGQVDALVAAFEQRAEEAPNDPAVQTDLGHAYLQKLFTVGEGPAKGVWAGKADSAFDAALALDETHWEARYSKAVSLSFWPPVFGKQTEAIKQFEILVGQQASSVPDPKFASTHLLLGNMYSQSGDMEKARAAWQHGLEIFPDNESLKKQLANSE